MWIQHVDNARKSTCEPIDVTLEGCHGAAFAGFGRRGNLARGADFARLPLVVGCQARP